MMKQLSEFTSVSEAREYQKVTSKMVSADMMRIFMLQTGLYGYFKNHTNDFQMATFDNMMSGGEFNFMDGHSSNVSGMMDMMIHGDEDLGIPEAESQDIKDALENLKTLCQNYANYYTNPYGDVASDEYNLAVAEANSVGATNASVYYGDYDSSQEWHVSINGKQTLIRIELDQAVEYDTTIKLYCSQRETGEQDFLSLPQAIYTPIVIEAGGTGAAITLAKNYGRHVKFQLVSNRPNSFKALVTSK